MSGRLVEGGLRAGGLECRHRPLGAAVHVALAFRLDRDGRDLDDLFERALEVRAPRVRVAVERFAGKKRLDVLLLRF